MYGERVEENVPAPVPHRQYVFNLPRLVRDIFARRRGWLGELCRIAERLLSHAYAEALPGGRPALIVFVQTFDNLVNFNPHLRVLAADEAFLPGGRFVTCRGCRRIFLPTALGAPCSICRGEGKSLPCSGGWYGLLGIDR